MTAGPVTRPYDSALVRRLIPTTAHVNAVKARPALDPMHSTSPANHAHSVTLRPLRRLAVTATVTAPNGMAITSGIHYTTNDSPARRLDP